MNWGPVNFTINMIFRFLVSGCITFGVMLLLGNLNSDCVGVNFQNIAVQSLFYGIIVFFLAVFLNIWKGDVPPNEPGNIVPKILGLIAIISIILGIRCAIKIQEYGCLMVWE